MCVGCVCCVSLQCTCVVCESQGFKLSCECIVPSLTPYLLILNSASRLLFKNAHICFMYKCMYPSFLDVHCTCMCMK